MSEDLRTLFEAAAAQIPDVPDRLDRVHARRRRRAQARSAAAVGAVALLGTGVAVVVPLLRSGASAPVVTAAEPGDCAHGGSPLPQDEELAPQPTPTPGPDGAYARTNHLTLRLLPSCTTVRVGQEVTIRVLAAGDAAEPSRDLLTLDGSSSQLSASCAGPGPTDPQPRSGTYEDLLRHTYSQPKTDVVTVGVDAICSPFRGRVRASVTITVLPSLSSAEPGTSGSKQG